MTTNFLPDGFETLTSEKKYWKLSQMKDGDNKFRIVMRPIGGWVDWKDNKPYRFRPNERPKTSFDPTKPIRPFWSCYVWDYAREDLFILDITQSSVLKALMAFGADSDWGDYRNYDIKIKREGTGKETRYHVTPLPHKPLNEQIKQAMNDSPINLEALYAGKDPWKDLADVSPEPIRPAPTNRLSEEQEAILDAALQEDRDAAEAKDKICSLLEIKDIYDMKPTDFERAMTWLKRRKSNSTPKKVA